MRTRTLIAAAVLAALPLFVGTLHAPQPRSTAVAAPAHHAAERPDPQWLYVTGRQGWDTALRMGEEMAGCRGCWKALFIAL